MVPGAESNHLSNQTKCKVLTGFGVLYTNKNTNKFVCLEHEFLDIFKPEGARGLT